MWESESQAKLTGHLSCPIPSFTNRGLSCRLMCSASGDDGTKGSAQRARSLRPRYFGVVDPETATHIYLPHGSS
jgi:hypothetical protein